MLIVAGTIDLEPDDRARFLTSKAEQVAATRRERGCLDYAFSADAHDLPRTPSGKVQKAELRRRLQDEAAWRPGGEPRPRQA